jgi:hypothetical protein
MFLEEMVIRDMIEEGLNPNDPKHVILFWARRLY